MKAKFFKEIKKVEQSSASGAGSEEIYESDYIHFHNLNFLRICNVVDDTTTFLDLENDEYFYNKENKGPKAMSTSSCKP